MRSASVPAPGPRAVPGCITTKSASSTSSTFASHPYFAAGRKSVRGRHDSDERAERLPAGAMIEAMSIYDDGPWTLSWDEADPGRHAFDAVEARAIIAGMTPALSDQRARLAWQEAVTSALTARFGRWTGGWAWGGDESDLGGGPVGSWCCLEHSVGTPEQTAQRADEALCEWRRWLDTLAGLFDTLTLPTHD